MSIAYTIGALSREAGVNLETIRYYERIGLIAEPRRSDSGYRQYGQDAVQRLRFVRRGRELGFAIEDIKTLLKLADHPEQPCDEADQLAASHLAAVEEKIRDLEAMRAVLATLTNCKSPSAEHCLLLETLDRKVCCLGP